MSTEPVLQVSNLSKQIGKKRIIDQISFEVPKGEIFGLLGPNGAGKTTIIRMIVGLMAASSGEIRINGHSLSANFEQAIKHVGAIVENPELYKFLTGYQNLLHYSRMVSAVTEERIEEVVSLVKLEDSIHERVKTYSLGMRQRLGVAQAVLHKPALLILDEPTNGLDPVGIRELRDYIRLLSRVEGTTVVVSSHLLGEMELICDRVGVIHHGQLVEVKYLYELVQQQKDDPQGVYFHVDQPVRVKDALLQLGWEKTFRQNGEGVEIELTKAQAAELNAQLVALGVRVYEIRWLGNTLENRFLEITRGGHSV